MRRKNEKGIMQMKLIKKLQTNDTGKVLLLLLFNILALSPLIVFAHVHYSMDAYVYEVNHDWAAAGWYIASFRYFAALITSIVSLTGHNPITNPVPDTIFFILIAAAAVTKLALYLFRIIKDSKNSILLFCIIEFSLLITVMNFWYTNILTFSECIFFNAIGLLLCFAAIQIYAERKTIVHVLAAAVLFVCAAASFQQFISVFTIYTIFILCIKLAQCEEKKTVRQTIVYYLKPCLFVICNSVIYYVLGIALQRLLHIVPTSRASLTLSTILDNAKYFISHQHSFLKGRGAFSTEILTVCYSVAAVIFVVSLVMYWRKTRRTSAVIFIGASFLAAYLVAFLPGLVSSVEARNGNRTICALFSVFALLSIGSIALYRHKVTNVLLASVLFLVFALNVYQTVEMEITQIIGNTNESAYAKNVAHEIELYEKRTGTSVDTIGVCYDKNGDLHALDVYTDFVAESLVSLSLDRPLKTVEVPADIYQKNFNDKDWQWFNASEQIVFDDHSAYICVY